MYSPLETESAVGQSQKLFDYSDTHVFDFEPNLKTLCLMSVIENNLDQTYLPPGIRYVLHKNSCHMIHVLNDNVN